MFNRLRNIETLEQLIRHREQDNSGVFTEVLQRSCRKVEQNAAASGLASDRSCRLFRTDLHFRGCARHPATCICPRIVAQNPLVALSMQKVLIPERRVCQHQVCLMPWPFVRSPPGRLLVLQSSVKPTSKFSRENSITQPGCRQLLLLTTMLTQTLEIHQPVLFRRWIADDLFGYVLDCSAEQYDSIILDSIPVGE